MVRYLVARVAWFGVVLLAVSVITFALGALAPGDPAVRVYERTRPGEPATASELDALRRDLGLDRPLPVQYLRWLGRVVQGDLGESWITGQSVARSLRQRLPRTAALAGTALVLSVAIALPVGLLTASRRNTLVDDAFRLWALAGASLPAYLVAYLLILYLAVRRHLLPVFGFESPAHLVLPALTRALGSAAGLSRFTRAAILEVLGEDYMQLARAKGASTRRVLFRHGLRNAILPVVTLVGLSLGGLLSGAFVVEWIFNWPGMGTLAVEAVNDKDYPVIQGFVIVTTTAYVVVNLLTDLAYAALDPRVRLTAD